MKNLETPRKTGRVGRYDNGTTTLPNQRTECEKTKKTNPVLEKAKITEASITTE